jgi:putative virulence factor
MPSEKQGFPDDRDLELQNRADRTCQMADDLVEWAGEHVEPRRETDSAIGPDEEFSLYRLRRLASNLWRSANVPVAAAVYGASQVGKSLFVGRVLEPADKRDSPLGKYDNSGPPAYFRELSFHLDINPQSGDNEATALVTRFTTRERFDETALQEYPVKVRALTRAEWLRVLARGFRSECVQPTDIVWREGQLRDLFEEVSQTDGADSVDREWRLDLLDVYAYMRNIDPLLYEVKESMFNSFLSCYPLTNAGYVEVAGRVFWDRQNYPALTVLFNDVCHFLEKVTSKGRDGVLVHWAAVKFLLDSQRTPVCETPDSQWQKRIAWQDLKDGFKDGWYVLDYEPGGQGPSEDLAIIQSAMLEMTIPVIPHRLKDDWRDVILKMDLLDLPGMRAGGSDSSGGATSIETIPEKMNVVKRGKVFYLIDRYLEEQQVQTFFLLVRGGLLEVRQLLKEYLDKWGKTRYGQDWPSKVSDSKPALFIGMTGIDSEFKDRPVSSGLYDNRLNQLANETLYEVMTDFGGKGQPFTNIYPIRYPGTWDFDEARRLASPYKGNWPKAGTIFVASPMVKKHVSNAAEKWQVAMCDDDGGLSLISQGFIDCTTSLKKQAALEEQLNEAQQDLRNLAEGWYCDPDLNADREARYAMGKKVLDWLDEEEHADEERVYKRVHALRYSLCFDEGEAMQLAEFSESHMGWSRTHSRALEHRFPEFLKTYLANWARDGATKRWREYTTTYDGGAPWLPMDDFSTFTRYLCDYFCGDDTIGKLTETLLSVITLAISDGGDRRHARREYVRVILNDYVLNPGPSDELIEPLDDGADRGYGLMDSFIRRWQGRLPAALASVAGEHVEIPRGNNELHQLLSRF